MLQFAYAVKGILRNCGAVERMKAMKKWAGIISNLTILTQFGLSFVTPLLLCLGICWWLTDRFALGGWVYLLGFFFGLGGSFTVASKLYLNVTAPDRKEKEKEKKKVSFNRHS